ncbi:MAG: FeS assembly protein SufD [uncultured bacterium]|nr:MAG: FeS assembly protein SufD [uncultured bacterium]
MLSPNAISKTAPNLEIKSDSVKAGHSASVGKVDEDALFYLQSRGIAEADAKSLLVAGFFESEFGAIADENIKNKIREAVANFLLK